MLHRILQAIQSRRQPVVRSVSDQSGQEMIEFTLTFVMLVVLFMALVIMGWMFYTDATITSAAREGSRHLMAYPTLPHDQVTFATSDQETTWVVTNSLPYLDWRQATVTIAPDVSLRVPGGYVLVKVDYTLLMPEFHIPLIYQDRMLTLGGPLQLHAMSRRNLD
jgi:Flp pilus assembly protein TadG